MSPPELLDEALHPIDAAKRLQGVGLRTVRGQPVGCLRWCGLGGIGPFHSWDGVLGRAEHRVGPQGAPGVVECVLLHQHPDVLTEGDTQRVGSNVHPRLHVLRHTSLHLDERGRCFPPSSSRTSSRHEHTLADKWAYLLHYRPACRTRGQPKVIRASAQRCHGSIERRTCPMVRSPPWRPVCSRLVMAVVGEVGGVAGVGWWLGW